ncbi:MAG: DUF4013 domain-containing protein [Candidatus Promineifilaceae bacterium]
MEIGKAFTFITSEDNWIKKIGIGAVVALFSGLIPIIPTMLIMGYGIQVGKNVLRGDEHPLPEWEEWGQLFMDGAVVWIVTFIYALPLMILGLCMTFLWLPVITEAADSGEFVFGGISGVATGGIAVLCCLLFLYFLVFIALVPAIYVQYIRTGEFGPLFRVGEVFGIARDNIGDIILAVVAIIVAGLLVGLVSVILSITICGGIIAGLVGGAWISVAIGHMFGQIAAKIDSKSDDAAYAM